MEDLPLILGILALAFVATIWLVNAKLKQRFDRPRSIQDTTGLPDVIPGSEILREGHDLGTDHSDSSGGEVGGDLSD
jgi:hypothetical protein